MIERSFSKLLLPLVCSGVLVAQEPSQDSVRTEPLSPIFWTSTQFSSNNLRRFPGRSLETLLQLVPGIGSVNGGLYGRGSRDGQIGYRVNGISVLDRYSNTNGFPFIPEAMEEVIVHTGAYGASLGANAGGSVEMKMREGGDTWRATAQHLTDDFAATGNKFLDTYSYGQHTSVFTLGGPLPYDTRLFVAAEVHRQRDREPMYITPFDYTITTGPYSANYYPVGTPLPGPFRMTNNHVPATSEDRTVLQWTVSSSFLGPQLKFWGSTKAGRNRLASWGTLVEDFYRQKRILWQNDRVSLFAGTVEHEFSAQMKVEGTLSYSSTRNFTSDPDFGENWWLYSDSVVNAEKGYTGFYERYYGPLGYVTNPGLNFSHPNWPNNSYEKREASVWHSHAMLTLSLVKGLTTRLAFESEYSTLRRFEIRHTSSLRSRVDANRDGISDYSFDSGLTGDLDVIRTAGTQTYGYNGWGVETESAPFGPRRPSVTSIALENAFTDGPVQILVGLRGQRYAEDIPTVLERSDIATGQPNIPFDDYLRIVRINAISPSTKRNYILPRISFSYTGAKSRSYLALATFVDALPYKISHIDHVALSGLLNPYSRVTYNLGGNVLTFPSVPERTVMYEAGGDWFLAEGVILSGSIFTKSMPNQVELGRIDVDDGPTDIISLVNRGEGRAVGGDLGVELTWPNGVHVAMRYAYLDARGHASSPRGNQIEVTDDPYFFPEVLYPLDYQQKHRISGLVKFVAGPESPLVGSSASLFARVNSGHPYTRMPSSNNIGASSLYNRGVNYLSPIYRGPSSEPQNVSVTPWTATFDLSAEYGIELGIARVRLLVSILNLFDTKNAQNLYATTGTTSSDGWLANSGAKFAISYYPGYEALYRDLNNRNRWAYMDVSGNDLFSSPRQLRFGVEVEL